MNTTWEWIETPLNGFVAYLCIYTALPVLKPRKTQPSEKSGNVFFDTAPTAAVDDVVKAGERDYVMRLPYTEVMLSRRQERGGDVPANWKPQVFDVGAVATDAVSATAKEAA